MTVRAISDVAGARPVSVNGSDFVALLEMLRCVSPEVGPVLRASSFLGAGATAGGGYAGHAELYDLDGLLRDTYRQPSMEAGVNDTLFGGGKGSTLAGTLLSTIGEAVERTVAGLVGCSPHLPGDRVLTSWSSLTARGENALDPHDIDLFSPAQYATRGFLYVPFTRETTVQWVPGRRAVSGERTWVPAQLVDMVHIYDPGEEIVGYPVSGGLSCHTSAEAAFYHGLTEVIERDAVNVSWYTDEAPNRLVVDDDVRSVLGGFVDRLQLDHSESHILVHPSDVARAPTVSVVGFQSWLRKRSYCAGGGCDASAVTALKKAAAEFGQTRATLGQSVLAPRSSVGVSVEKMFDWDRDRPLAEMTLFFQAIGYYGLDGRRPLLDSYLSGPTITLAEVLDRAGAVESDPVSRRLEVTLDDLGARGIDPVVLDYSHPDWNQLAIRKVLVPELTTPFLQSRPMLGHPRFASLRASVLDAQGTALPLPYP